MFRWIRRKIDAYIIRLILERIIMGGNCGLCGKRIEDELFDVMWSWGMCREHMDRPNPKIKPTSR